MWHRILHGPLYARALAGYDGASPPTMNTYEDDVKLALANSELHVCFATFVDAFTNQPGVPCR